MLTLTELAAIPEVLTITQVAQILAAYPNTKLPTELIDRNPYFEQLKGNKPLTKKAAASLEDFAIVVLANQWRLNIDLLLTKHAGALNTSLGTAKYRIWFKALLDQGCLQYTAEIPNFYHLRDLLDKPLLQRATQDIAPFKREWFHQGDLRGLSPAVLCHPGNFAAITKMVETFVDVGEFKAAALTSKSYADFNAYLNNLVNTAPACVAATDITHTHLQKGLLRGFSYYLDACACKGEIPWSSFVAISERPAENIISRGQLPRNFTHSAFKAAVLAGSTDAVTAFKTTPFHPLCADIFEELYANRKPDDVQYRDPAYIRHHLLRIVRTGYGTVPTTSDHQFRKNWTIQEIQKTWNLSDQKMEEFENLLQFVGLEPKSFGELFNLYSKNEPLTYFEQLAKVLTMTLTATAKPTESLPEFQVAL